MSKNGAKQKARKIQRERKKEKRKERKKARKKERKRACKQKECKADGSSCKGRLQLIKFWRAPQQEEWLPRGSLALYLRWLVAKLCSPTLSCRAMSLRRGGNETKKGKGREERRSAKKKTTVW